MIVGYVRLNPKEQKLDHLFDAFKAIGVEKIFVDKVPTKGTDRTGFIQMMEFVQEGDDLYVLSMDRLARSTRDLLTVIKHLKSKDVSVHFLKENINVQCKGNLEPTYNLLLTILGAVAEFEQSLIRERQAGGISLAKRRGLYKGRKPISLAVIEEAKRMIGNGVPKTIVAKKLNISRKTLYNRIKNR